MSSTDNVLKELTKMQQQSLYKNNFNTPMLSSNYSFQMYEAMPKLITPVDNSKIYYNADLANIKSYKSFSPSPFNSQMVNPFMRYPFFFPLLMKVSDFFNWFVSKMGIFGLDVDLVLRCRIDHQ